jgi:1-phosphofructokinase family hexose kinase
MTDMTPIITVTLNPAVDKVLRVPGFCVGGHMQAEPVSRAAAGKGINVARGIAHLGGTAETCTVEACAFMDAETERLFAESLARDGVATAFCTVTGRVRTNTTILDPVARTTTHLREPGFTVSVADVERIGAMLVERIAAHGEATVVFSGSLPPGMDTDAFVSLLWRCASAGARLVVDTSGPALRAAVDSGTAGVVKPNAEELATYLGGDLTEAALPEAARKLVGRVGTVLLTLGAGGAWAVDERSATGRRCVLDDSELGNTVGCGDAFLAGWLYGRARGESVASALEWGVAAGAAAAMSDETVGYAAADVQRLRQRCTALSSSEVA